MKKKVVLIGAKGNAHAGVVLDIIREYSLYDVIGFLDDNRALQNTAVLGVPVLGTVQDFLQNVPEEVSFFVCIGNNLFRKNVQELIKKHQREMVNVIHPTAIISASAKLGQGIFIGAKVVITHNVQMGDGVLINTAATIDHDNILGDYVNVCPGCHTSGRVKIKESAFLGTGVTVIPDITIGEQAVVGAGSVVIKDVEPGTTVVGVPAHKNVIKR